jgi:hypothetical protein
MLGTRHHPTRIRPGNEDADRNDYFSQWMWLFQGKGRMFFLERNNQRTFTHFGPSAASGRTMLQKPSRKSFLLLFFKKEGLT